MARVARHIGFCPVCERDIKVQYNELVHHGYQRPGYGYIVGDCYGVHRPPHEVSPDTAIGWQETVTTQLRAAERALTTDWPPKRIGYWNPSRHWQRSSARDKEYAVMLAPDDIPVLDEQGHTLVSAYNYEEALRSVRWSLERQYAGLQEEHDRITRLIATWVRLPLRTVMEEQEAAAQRKRTGMLEREAKREAKLAAMVASYQKRLDSAARQKKIDTVMDIWESAWDKLPDASGRNPLGRPNITGEDAILLLDRDALWRELGVMDAAGHVLRPRDWREVYDWQRKVEQQAVAAGWKRRY